MTTYRFLTRKCRPWLPCNDREHFHTHHLVYIWPPRRLRRHDQAA